MDRSTVKELIDSLPKDLAPQAAPGTWECALGEINNAGHVLCAGAGRGGLSHILSKLNCTVESVDLHPEHFAADALKCVGADLNCPLAYPDAVFDTVLAVEVVEHLENPWFFLREAIRVLKPDGCLVFTSPNVVSLSSKLNFLRTGQLDYFREESFVGCYHVTPIFPWGVDRWATTTDASLSRVTYSRADWPSNKDIPRFYGDRSVRRFLKSMLPLNRLTGEITCYVVVKAKRSNSFEVGTHYR